MKKPIQVYLEEEEIKQLKKVAIDKGITLTALIRLYVAVKNENITKEMLKGDDAKFEVKKIKSVPQAEEKKPFRRPVKPTGKLCKVHKVDPIICELMKH